MLYIKWRFGRSNLYPFIVDCGQNKTLVNVITCILKGIIRMICAVNLKISFCAPCSLEGLLLCLFWLLSFLSWFSSVGCSSFIAQLWKSGIMLWKYYEMRILYFLYTAWIFNKIIYVIHYYDFVFHLNKSIDGVIRIFNFFLEAIKDFFQLQKPL